MYEQASERWSPVQSVEKVLLSVISMLAGTFLQPFFFPPKARLPERPQPHTPLPHLFADPADRQTPPNRTESGERCKHRLLQAL